MQWFKEGCSPLFYHRLEDAEGGGLRIETLYPWMCGFLFVRITGYLPSFLVFFSSNSRCLGAWFATNGVLAPV